MAKPAKKAVTKSAPAKKTVKKKTSGGKKLKGATLFVGGFWPHATIHPMHTPLQLRGWLRGAGGMPANVHARLFQPAGTFDITPIPVANWKFNFTIPAAQLGAPGEYHVVVYLNNSFSGEITGTAFDI